MSNVGQFFPRESVRTLGEPLKHLKIIILDEEPLEPLKCVLGPISDFNFISEPLYASFDMQNEHFFLVSEVHFYQVPSLYVFSKL